ncbi:unnamed protein product [Ambrosiozyma monospora]|uniref:Unnamed protein product n=1 Tax=Ambrosiozyma monospora TaxID=43982 RepID=A0A9W6YRA6_AMBMO|nr:unnamed protein product [Ambrosiozyma monospora]
MRLPKRKNIKPTATTNSKSDKQLQSKKGAIKDENGIPYNYIIIIDAGSKGTRAYVYNWPSVQYMLANGHLKTTDTIDSISKDDLDLDVDMGLRLGLPNVDLQLVKRVDLDIDDLDLKEKEEHEQQSQNDHQDGNDDDNDNDNDASTSTTTLKPNNKFKIKSTNMNPITPINAKSLGLPEINSGFKWHKKIKPGITSFKDTTASKIGSNYLTHLLKKLYLIIPREQHYRTPIFMHATAGMRLLTPTQQNEILNEACDFLIKESGFYLPDCQTHVNVIDGDVEGLFGWIAVNSMTGNLKLLNPEPLVPMEPMEPLQPSEPLEARDTVAHSDSDSELDAETNPNPNPNSNPKTTNPKANTNTKTKPTIEESQQRHVDTVGLLELGGASTQVSFEPNDEETNKHLNQLIKLQLSTIGSIVPDLNYNVYSTSFLGYGLSQIHDRYLERLILKHLQLQVQLQLQVRDSDPDSDPDPASSSFVDVGVDSDVYSAKAKDSNGNDSDLIVDPCLPANQEKLIDFNDQIYTIIGSGDFTKCNELIYPLLIKDMKECSSKKQPDVSSCLLTDNVPQFDFLNERFVGVSGYWDTISKLLKFKFTNDGDEVDLKQLKSYGKVYSYDEMLSHTKKICSLSSDDLRSDGDGDGNVAGLDKSEVVDLCFKSTYLLNLLHNGLGLSKTSSNVTSTDANIDDGNDNGNDRIATMKEGQLTINDKINGLEFTWTLGRALLYASDESSIEYFDYVNNLNDKNKHLLKNSQKVGYFRQSSPGLFIRGSEQDGVELRPSFEIFDDYENPGFFRFLDHDDPLVLAVNAAKAAKAAAADGASDGKGSDVVNVDVDLNLDLDQKQDEGSGVIDINTGKFIPVNTNQNSDSSDTKEVYILDSQFNTHQPIYKKHPILFEIIVVLLVFILILNRYKLLRIISELFLFFRSVFWKLSYFAGIDDFFDRLFEKLFGWLGYGQCSSSGGNGYGYAGYSGVPGSSVHSGVNGGVGAGVGVGGMNGGSTGRAPVGGLNGSSSTSGGFSVRGAGSGIGLGLGRRGLGLGNSNSTSSSSSSNRLGRGNGNGGHSFRGGQIHWPLFSNRTKYKRLRSMDLDLESSGGDGDELAGLELQDLAPSSTSSSSTIAGKSSYRTSTSGFDNLDHPETIFEEDDESTSGRTSLIGVVGIDDNQINDVVDNDELDLDEFDISDVESDDGIERVRSDSDSEFDSRI